MKGYLYQKLITQENINLNKVYDKLNNLIYKGHLPDVNFFWVDDPKIRAKTLVDGNENNPDTWVIKGIQVSTTHPMIYKDLLGVIAHEMIHINRVLKGIKDPEQRHNQEFNKEVYRINNMNLGFKIPFVEVYK